MSEPSEAARTEAIAFELYAAGQPLASAIFYVEAVRRGAAADAWASLGCALADCAGVFVRTPFFETADVAFRRALLLGLEGPMLPVVEERRATLAPDLGKHLSGASKLSAGADSFLAKATPDYVSDAALDALQSFLVLDAHVIAKGVGHLSPSLADEARELARSMELDRFESALVDDDRAPRSAPSASGGFAPVFIVIAIVLVMIVAWWLTL